MDKITITKEEFIDKAALASLNYVKGENISKSRHMAAIIITGTFTAYFMNLLFGKDEEQNE